MSEAMLSLLAALHRTLRTPDDPRSYRVWFSREAMDRRGFAISQPTFSRWIERGFPNKRKRALFELVVLDLHREVHIKRVSELADLDRLANEALTTDALS